MSLVDCLLLLLIVGILVAIFWPVFMAACKKTAQQPMPAKTPAASVPAVPGS